MGRIRFQEWIWTHSSACYWKFGTHKPHWIVSLNCHAHLHVWWQRKSKVGFKFLVGKEKGKRRWMAYPTWRTYRRAIPSYVCNMLHVRGKANLHLGFFFIFCTSFKVTILISISINFSHNHRLEITNTHSFSTILGNQTINNPLKTIS